MSAADKVKLDAVDGRIQGVKVYKDETDGFIIQDTEFDDLKATIGTEAHIGKNANIGEEVTINNNAIIGTDSIGTNLIGAHEEYSGYNIAIGSGVRITNGVGIAIDDDGILNWGRDMRGSYTIKKAATTDDLSALETRVSALEDLLKLA